MNSRFTTYLTAAVASRLSINELLDVLQTDPANGLSPAEAERRLLCYGHNQPNHKSPVPLWLKYLYQFRQPMIALLLISAAVSLAFHQFDDAISITVAVIIVVTVGFIQEYRSEKALTALSNLLPVQAKCIRQQKLVMIPATELVPGDIICLESGDRVPADARLVETTQLLVDESTFTGENELVHKVFNADHNERVTTVYAGSMVRQGRARGVVVATGEYSEFGSVLKLMREEDPPETPLQSSMDHLSRQLSAASVTLICFIVFIGHVFTHHPLKEMLSIGVSLAVAAIPEGLPIVVTVTLALGVLRMAKRKTIIRHIQSVETMGRVSTVCFDKTGTLTLNRMSVHSVVSAQSDVVWTTANPKSHPSIEAVLHASLLCNNAELYRSDGSPAWHVRGQPTEGAFWLAAIQYFPHLLDDLGQWRRVNEWPFCSEKRWMAVTVENDFKRKIIMKGAAETVLEQCGDKTKHMNSMPAEMAGLRMLALAEGYEFGSLQLLGYVGIYDPIRVGAKDLVQDLRDSHSIQVLLITGDSMETAKYVAESIGLKGSALSGQEAEKLANSYGNFGDKCVFYRTDPKQKLTIVRALQRHGRVVAMVGDGINDAVALRAADVGIAVGASSADSEATDVSREAADVILLDDNIRSIATAIEEGKCIFYNIQNFVRFQLSTSVSALSLIALGTIFGSSPLNAMQILWINIIMDGPPAQSLGVEPSDPAVTKKKQSTNQVNILNRELLLDVLIKASVIVTGTLCVFATSFRATKTRRTTLTFTCFVLFDMFNALSCRSKDRSIFKLGFFTNSSFCWAILFSLVGQALAVYWRPLQYVFQTESLFFSDVVWLVFVSSSVFFISELLKRFKPVSKSYSFSV